MARIDPHSYFDTDQPRAKHVRLRWQVDFHTHQLTGNATLVFETLSSGTVDLDSKGLTITAVQTGYGKVGVYLARNTAWTETSAVHELPARGRTLTSLTTNFVAGQKYELDLGDAVKDNGILNIILVGPNGGLTFSSSEGGNKPELRVVTLRGGLATGEVTMMAAKVETSTTTTNWQEQLKVYPNPFEDNIAVAFDEEITGGMTVEVLDRNGRPVFTESRMNPGKSMVLDIRHLNMQPGMYFLKVKVNGIETKTLRIFKR